VGVRVPPTAPVFQKYLLKFLGLFHRGGSSCHTSRTQFVVPAHITITDVCRNMQLIPMVIHQAGTVERSTEAEAFSKRLSDVLEGAWSATTDAHQ